MFRRNPKHAVLVEQYIEQYIDKLLIDPTAPPPEGLDDKTVAMIQSLMEDTPPSAAVRHHQERVWDQVLFMIHLQPDAVMPPLPDGSKPQHPAPSIPLPPPLIQKTYLLRRAVQPALLAFVAVVVFMGGLFLQTELETSLRGHHATSVTSVAVNIPDDIELDAGESLMYGYYQPAVYYTPLEDIPLPDNITLSEGEVAAQQENIPTPRADYNLIVR